MADSKISKAAERYAANGWRVFPLYELAGGICACGKGSKCPSPGKHPRISIPRGKPHPATTDVKQIRAWWKKWPQANIGVWLEGSKLLILDIDRNDKKDGFEGLRQIMAYENVKELPQTLTCLTPSGGKHLYFNLCEGVPNKANSLGPGLDTWHSQHYVIVPPSNHAAGTNYAWDSSMPKTIADFPEWLKPKQRQAAAPKVTGKAPKERLDPNDPDDVERLQHALSFVDNTDRDKWVMVGFALARAFDWSTKGFEIYDTWSKAAHNYDERKTREQYYKQSRVTPASPITTASIFEWARQHPDYTPWEENDDRPFEIRERPSDELRVLVDMADVLYEFPIYQRGPKLVEIVPVNTNLEQNGHWLPKGSYVLREIQPDQLASRILPAKVKWMRKTPKGWRPTSVSIKLAASLLNIGNWPKAKKLRAFVQHPTLRDDGTVLHERGYDERSGLFLTESIDVQIPEKPTKKDAMKALDVLIEPFREYKWVDGRLSLAALMAAVFTVGIRHLFEEGVPLFAIDAPRQGAGKSKLAKAISNLWFGRTMATTPYSNDPEEMKKHLAAMLLNGDRVVLFDNVHPRIRVNDPTLNALLTSGRVTFRELGSQRMLEFDSTATFFMTGNQLKIVGDMIRRTIRIQIDPGGLHPHLRKFQIDPLEGWVLEHRTQLLSAALTILLAFFRAGKPKMSGSEPPLASFEDWSNIVRELLMWLELDDVKECITQGYEQDEESAEIEHLLTLLFALPELQRDSGVSSLELLPIVDANKALKEAVQPFIGSRNTTGVHDPRTLSNALGQVAKITVNHRRLIRVGTRWSIREEE